MVNMNESISLYFMMHMRPNKMIGNELLRSSDARMRQGMEKLEDCQTK
jgi:hypothetical protein